MATLPDITFSSLQRDWKSLKDEMISRIPFFTPEWTDRSLSDPGIALIHVFAWVLDAYHWVSELLLNEAFPATCKRRSSLQLHLHAQGTDLLPPTAASASVVITVESISSSLVAGGASLKAGFKFRAALPETSVIFELTSGVDLPGEGESITATVREGRTLPSALVIGTSTGRPFQRFQIPSATVLHNVSQKTIRVRVNGIEWAEVESLGYSDPNDSHFMIWRDQNKFPIVIFGDDNSGSIPITGATIDCIYAEGGGERGNKASAGTINQIVSPEPLGYRLSVTNGEGAAGGSDWEMYEVARRRGPVYWAAQERALIDQDYEALVLTLPEVVRVRAEPNAFTVVQLWVVPQGGGQASDLIRQNVLNAVSAHRSTDSVEIGDWDPDVQAYRSAYYTTVDIAINVRVTQGYSQALIRFNVITAIQNYFDPAERNFGELPSGYLYLSDFFELVESLSGVDSLDVLRFGRRSEPFWVRKAGDVTIAEAQVLSNSPPEEVWWVEFISSKGYRVYGEDSGGQGVGVLDQSFTAREGYFTFTIFSGATEMREGDKFWFKTGRRVGNVQLDPNEFPVLGRLAINLSGGY